MRILLIQPPVEDFYDTDIRLQPLGLAYLKATINQHLPLVEVIIKDYHQGHSRQTVPLPSELGYLKPYYEHLDNSPFCTFHHYYHFGAPFDSITTDIETIQPDIVGISSLFTPYYREVLHITSSIKKRLPHTITLVGGSHVSAIPESILSDPSVDFVIRGEGERPIIEWLKCFMKGELHLLQKLSLIPNLGFKYDGKMILNPIQENYPLNEIPIPRLDDLPLAQYHYYGKPLAFLITSRSCPHRCSFCSVHLTFGTNYRTRPIEQVLEEIWCRYQEGFRVIDFEDDNLTFYQKEMVKLCEGIIQLFPGQEMQFVAMNGISYLSLSEELLTLMKKANFTHLNLALVTSDKTVRETTKRPHTIEKYLQVVEWAYKLGFQIVSYQILGLPTETLESMIQTLTFNAQLPVLLGASPFYLTPNSPIASQFGKLDKTDFFKSRLTAFAHETEFAKREDLYTLFITTRIFNFLKGFNIDQETTLEQLQPTSPKEQQGVLLLQKLFAEKKLFYSYKKQIHPNKKFNYELFMKVLERTEFVTTRTHQKIFFR